MNDFITVVIKIMSEFAMLENIELDVAIDRVSITHQSGQKNTLREIIEHAF